MEPSNSEIQLFSPQLESSTSAQPATTSQTSHSTTAHDLEVELADDNETGFYKICFNAVNNLIGVGLLSVGYALSHVSWLGLVHFTIVAESYYYTALILNRLVVSEPQIRSYTDVGLVSFGTTGWSVISVLLYLKLYLVAVEFLILEGDNLTHLFPSGLGIKIGGARIRFIVLTALIVLPTTWLRSLGMLAYVSMGGIFVSLLLILSVV